MCFVNFTRYTSNLAKRPLLRREPKVHFSASPRLLVWYFETYGLTDVFPPVGDRSCIVVDFTSNRSCTTTIVVVDLDESSKPGSTGKPEQLGTRTHPDTSHQAHLPQMKTILFLPVLPCDNR